MYKAGGIERTVFYRLKALSENHEVYVVTMENGNRPFYFGNLDKVQNFDINSNFDREKSGKFKLNFSNLFKTIVSYLKMQFLFFKVKPEITVNVVGLHSLVFIPMLFNSGITVMEHHSSLYQIPPNRLKKFLMKRFLHHVFLTEEEGELAYFLKNKKVIPNPIELPSEQDVSNFSKKNKIIAAGRIVEVKGFDRLIKAWSLIEAYHSDWVLEIYGQADIDVLDRLENMILNLKLVGRVVFKESTPLIKDIMLESKIYAMTSHFECFPMVLLEAMSAKMFVVAFDCPTGPRNILNNDCGFLIENGNIENFSYVLNDIILNEKKYTNITENAKIQSLKYDVNKIVYQWDSWFNSLGK